MIVVLLGKAGAGKTTVAKEMEKIVKDSFVIDGDELRLETKNNDIGVSGRESNMHLGFSRARRLSDLGFTVFVSMQAPIREIREQYLTKYDKQVIIKNIGDNPKDDLGFNENFNPDYSDVENIVCVSFKDGTSDFCAQQFYDFIFPKVLVPARFQTMHTGHKVIFEEARRISPNVTVALRVDDNDLIPLEQNMELIQEYASYYNINVIKSPDINEDWGDFISKFDIFVQGNPVVIEKFTGTGCKLHFVPRYGNVSATMLRESIKNGENGSNKIDASTLKLTKESLNC